MGLSKSFETTRSKSVAQDSIEQLVAENFRLQQTAVEIEMQTAILRERLLGSASARRSEKYLGHEKSRR